MKNRARLSQQKKLSRSLRSSKSSKAVNPSAYTAPGVYIEEIVSGVHPIAEAETSVAAFAGAAKRGPVNKPVLVKSFRDFTQHFGGLMKDSELGYSVSQYFLNGGRQARVVRIAKDADAAKIFKGLSSLDMAEPFNLLVLPAVTNAEVLFKAAAFCEKRRAFMIIDAPREAASPQQMLAVMMGAVLPAANHAAVYYPWIRIADPLRRGRLRTSAPGGTVAGLFVRTDLERGVWKSPAGQIALAGVRGLAYEMTDQENGLLNPRGVNCLRHLPSYGYVVWGSRTLRGDDSFYDEYKYIPVKRLALCICVSLERGTEWVVHEPNDEPLWSKIRLDVDAFLNSLWRRGALAGVTQKEAYFVKCGLQTTSQAELLEGLLNIEAGFAPLKPAEFIILRIRKKMPTA